MKIADFANDKARRSKATAATTVFAAIRSEILTGALAPGLRLKVDWLCERYDSSINPVREALNRLVAEGLVMLEDQRGFAVAPVSLEDWRDLVRSRCLIEGCALREAIANRTDAWEEGVVLSLHWLQRTERYLDTDRRTPNPDWEPRHHAFHNALLVTCNSRLVLDFCTDMRDRSDRYRQIAAISPIARRSSADEHSNIAAAALAGDGDRATSLLAEHYHRTLEVVEGYFSSKG